jgi:catechol 2,3-dioxygenase-like lactoylglutathione lyase family enzyme/predicted enzyme related to lactoylglutathione lyase
MTVRLVAVSFDVREPSTVAVFWAGMLGRDIIEEEEGALLPGDETQVGLRFLAADTEEGTGPNRVHLHLTSSDFDDQSHSVALALDLGGRIIRQKPDEGYVVMADPGRNEFCVIEPENNYLAGTGYLGEVTCEGPPEAGYFWRDALGWRLVWEEGDQTGIQSPLGGTKISWDVRSGSRPYGSKRQRFDLETNDLAGEVARLTEMGATELGRRDGVVEMTDPGGNEFSVRASH